MLSKSAMEITNQKKKAMDDTIIVWWFVMLCYDRCVLVLELGYYWFCSEVLRFGLRIN